MIRFGTGDGGSDPRRPSALRPSLRLRLEESRGAPFGFQVFAECTFACFRDVTQPLDYRRVLFFEEQRFPQVGVTLLLCGSGAVEIGVGLFVLVLTRLFGRAPSRFHLCTELAAVGLGALIIVLRFVIRLRVIVDCDGIRVSVHPMPLRKYPWKLFGGCEVRTYRALADHAGRGSMRLRDGAGWAYTAWGDRGVALRLTQGQTLFIGSQVPENLCAAIREALARA